MAHEKGLKKREGDKNPHNMLKDVDEEKEDKENEEWDIKIQSNAK